MNINQAFPSKFFKADDLAPGETKTLIISQFAMERVKAPDGTENTRPILYFSNHEQGLVLNRTKADVIAEALGEDTDGWIGHAIIITRGMTTFAGKRVGCIDVHAKAPKGNGFPTPPHVQTQGMVNRQQRQQPPAVKSYDGPEDGEYDPLG